MSNPLSGNVLGPSVQEFLKLTDTPNSFSGQAGKLARVNSGATALEFAYDGIRSGTSFPGSPSSGDVFFRTDLGLLCYYDGSRWLTTNEYNDFRWIALSAAGNHSFGGVLRSDLAAGIYVTKLAFQVHVATTHNASNYYDLGLHTRNADTSSWTFLDSRTSWSVVAAANTWGHVTATPNITQLSGTTNIHWLWTYIGKNGSPGTMNLWMCAFYRLVVT